MQLGFLLMSLAMSLLGQRAWAGTNENLQASTSSYFQGVGLNFLSHSVLQSTCNSSNMFNDEIPCNPSNLANSKRVVFGANVLLGDDYETLYKNKDLINANDKRGLALNLIKKTGTVQFETASQMWARIQNYSLVFVPLRWTYYSNVVNSSYSDISIHAMQEQSLSFLVASEFESNYRFGLAIRGVERKIIHESFNLFDALADIDKYLNVKSQRLLLFEPSLIYSIDKSPGQLSWNPRLSAKLTQLGFVTEKIEGLPVKPFLELGVGVNPPVELGVLEVLLAYKLDETLNEERKYRIGTVYQYGLATLMAGFDAQAWALGITNTFRFINVGLNYKRNVDLDVFGNKSYSDSVSLEFRLLL